MGSILNPSKTFGVDQMYTEAMLVRNPPKTVDGSSAASMRIINDPCSGIVTGLVPFQ